MFIRESRGLVGVLVREHAVAQLTVGVLAERQSRAQYTY